MGGIATSMHRVDRTEANVESGMRAPSPRPSRRAACAREGLGAAMRSRLPRRIARPVLSGALSQPTRHQSLQREKLRLQCGHPCRLLLTSLMLALQLIEEHGDQLVILHGLHLARCCPGHEL